MNIKICRLSLLTLIILTIVSGCQPSYSTEMVISLSPKNVDMEPDAPTAESLDPLDVLVVVEKIAAANSLKIYETDNDEKSLLDIADSDDLMDESSSKTVNITYWQHPNLPVYLTVTRNPNEILLLLNHTPDESGKASPEAKKLYDTLNTELHKKLPQQNG